MRSGEEVFNLLKRRRVLSRKRRGSQLLEFALLIPMALVLITFSVDMGRLILATTSLSDATAVAARAGARVGYAGAIPAPGNCTGGVGTSNPSYNAFCQAATVLGGSRINSVELLTPSGLGDRPCIAGAESTEYVTVRARATLDFITPGLTSIVKLALDSKALIEVTGTARCEVTR